MNRYKTHGRSILNEVITGQLNAGDSGDSTFTLGDSTNRWTTAYCTSVDATQVTATNLTKSFDGPFSTSGNSLYPYGEDLNQVVYSTTGSVANINNVATTFTTPASGECGLFIVYNSGYTATCFGQYLGTTTPLTYIATGSPALSVTASGSDLKVAFASSTTPQTVYFKLLKFN